MTLTGKSMFMAKKGASVKNDADTALVEDQDGTLITQEEFEKRMKQRIEEARRDAASRGN